MANEFSNSVSVLLNNSDGTFADSTRVDYSLGFNPTSVFSADIDGDGDNDLAVANDGSDNVSVLLNNGDGRFAPRVDYPAGDGSRSAFSADFDGDGDNDLAVANFNSDNVSVLLNLSTMPSPPPVDTASVSLPNVSTLVGDTVSVAVAVEEDVTALGIFSAQIKISYDSDLITAINVALEGTLTQGWVIDDTVVTGSGTSIDTIKIAIATPGPDTLSGSGDIVLIKFAVSDSAVIGDSIPLVFEEFFFNEGDPAANTQDGSVQILGLGDVSGNGRVTAFDAALVLRSTVGLIVISDTLIADVSGDGTISAFDASLMLRFVVGKITVFPAETGGTPKIVLGERIVTLGDVEDLENGRFAVPVFIDEMDGVLSGQFELSFDPIKFKAVDATTSDLTSDYLFAHNAQDGRIRLSFAGIESVQGSGRIAEIIFEPVDSGIDDIGEIDVISAQLNEGLFNVVISQFEGISKAPNNVSLYQNYPNPFNPQTVIHYDLLVRSHLKLSVYNIMGQKVATLVDGQRSAGSYSIVWDGKNTKGEDLASGIYFYRMETDRVVQTRKLILMR